MIPHIRRTGSISLLIMLLLQLNHGKYVLEENIQKLTFFSNEDYTGERESFSQTNLDIQGTTIVGRVAKSFCIEKGVWLVYGNVSYGPPGPGRKENPDFDISNGLLASGNMGMICVSLHNDETGQSAIYTQIRHLAGYDMDATSLSLYDGRWKGDEHFVAGESLRLPAPIPVSSFAFTGNVPWTLSLASGDEFCLPAHGFANDPFEMGIAFAAVAEPIWVSSARMGCDEVDFDKENEDSPKVVAELVQSSQNVIRIYPEPPPGLVRLDVVSE